MSIEIPPENSEEQTTEELMEGVVETPEQEKEQEVRINLIKGALEAQLPSLIKLAETALGKKGFSISDEDKERFRNLLISTDEVTLKVLEIGSSFSEKVKAISGVASPLLEKEIRIKERENEGEKISKKQKIKEKLRVVVPNDREKDKDYMGKLADLLDEVGKATGGKVGLALVALNKILDNEKVQEKVSDEFRNWMNEDETEENAENANDGINIEDIEEEIGEIVKELDFDDFDFAKKF